MKYAFALLAVLLVSSTPATAADIKAVLANPDRSAADKALDEKRKPDQVIEFFGIEPGMSVIDIFAGDGYYSEIVAGVVGDSGFVTLYNNRPWDDFVGKSVTERLAGNRLPNVDRLIAAPEDLIDVPDQFDAGIFILGMHDIYYTDAENGWPAIDRDRFLRGIYSVIADGGVLGVIDHNARPGADAAAVSKELHRIDPAVIVRDLEAVGFKLEAESDILRNPDDNFDMIVFDESVRRKTDRSILRFRK